MHSANLSWFQKQRMDFIRANLQAYGMIRRQQIMDKFEVTAAIASSDIAAFMAAYPNRIDYDRRTKCYNFDGTDL